jgi:hypothetical protein
MNLTPFRLTAVLALALWAVPTFAAPEADAEQVRATTVKLINQLVEQGVLTREKADALLAEMNKPSAAPAPVRVPYMPEFMRKELKDEVQLDLAAQAAREGWAKPGAVPAWVRGLAWEGDVRTRYQFDNFAADNAPALSVNDTNRNRAVALANTTDDRRRFRVRARTGLNASIDENWAAGVRLTTGSTTDPLSSNQTLGAYGNRFTTAFDRAYIRYRYGSSFNAVAGRFGNPWFGTDLVWANDLGFDGVALQYTPSFTPAVRGFVTLAAMPIQEVELSTADKWLYGVQVGASQSGTARDIGAKIGLGYYRYTNMVGQLSPVNSTLNEFSAPQFAQKGNSYYNISSDPARPLLGLASDYRLINLTGQLDFAAGEGKRAVLTGDYVRNVGFDRAAVSARVGVDIDPQIRGYQLRGAYGTAEVSKPHDWQAFLAYKRVERDAVLDAFTDSDFHLGGTDAKGYILGGSYGLGKNTAVSLRYFSGDAISGPPLAIDVIQLDLSVHF